MRTINLALVGFGSVGRAFARLIEEKSSLLAEQYGLCLRVTGIATARHGMVLNSGGINLMRALEQVELGGSLALLSEQPVPQSLDDFIFSSGADVLFENIPVNHYSGQPAIDILKTGILKGMHVITANKGPVAHAYRELTDLAASRGKRFMFESAVLDGAPVFSLQRACLPTAELRGFYGILNSCTNFLLTELEEGRSWEAALEKARSIGITETDPSADVDGWDAAIKVACLSTVLMGIPLKPQQVVRSGIGAITSEEIEAARKDGQRWKLVCRARRKGNQLLQASVGLERIGPESPLYSVSGTSSFLQLETDVLPGLGILESNPGPQTTAFGLLADLINALRGV